MPKTLRLCGLARKLKKQADFFAILIFIRIFAPSESPQRAVHIFLFAHSHIELDPRNGEKSNDYQHRNHA